MVNSSLLYHYTDANGLIGLLGQSCLPSKLWLTQVQYMNDDLEFYHAFELAREYILDMRTQYPGVRKVISGLWGIPYENEHQHIYPLKGNILHRIFSFSLTESKDLLSQWRGYAYNGGYCLGFRVSDLERFASIHGFSLKRCVYNDLEKREKISEIIQRIEGQLNRGEIDYSIESMSSVPESERSEATARVEIQNSVNSVASYFKHSSFEEEREWRIVGIMGAEDPRAKWRARGNAVIPYCEADTSPEGSSPLPVVEVIVGPGLDFEHSKHAIEMMKYKYLQNINISSSSCTLRR